MEFTVQPYTFNGAYDGCYAEPSGAMDFRHVFMLHDILRGWDFRNALELGSYNGASATAFVEAINAGSPMVATFCDIEPTESLWNVVRHCYDPAKVRVTKESSYLVLESAENFDFVLVDASHDIASVTAELQRLILRKPLCVMGHDTNASATGYPLAEGAALLKRAFQLMPEYQCIEDAKWREGEETHRGLFLATTSAELFALAERAYEKWS